MFYDYVALQHCEECYECPALSMNVCMGCVACPSQVRFANVVFMKLAHGTSVVPGSPCLNVCAMHIVQPEQLQSAGSLILVRRTVFGWFLTLAMLWKSGNLRSP